MKKLSAASLEKGCVSQSKQSAEAAAKKARAAAKSLVASVEPVSRTEATFIAMGIVAAG
ncbi:hypothetical protein [Sutterella sp.]|uniref:hypothetical protein n=1 Tax=Sutterella sp. TaxID=1981025 RepID=UPI003FD7A79B